VVLGLLLDGLSKAASFGARGSLFNSHQKYTWRKVLEDSVQFVASIARHKFIYLLSSFLTASCGWQLSPDTNVVGKQVLLIVVI